jgi:hypothetical protein
MTFADCVQNPKLIPGYAFSQFHDKCLTKCVQVGGIIKSYIKQGIRGGRIFAIPGNYDDLILLDVNSLYPTALYNMSLPIGIPKIWCDGMDLTNKFAVLTVNITSINTPRKQYYKLTLGTAVYDTIALNTLVKSCGIEYDIITGYVWQTPVVPEVRSYIDDLYSKKASSSGFDHDVFKLMLNAPLGKCLKKSYKTSKRKVFNTKDAALKYATRNHHMLNHIEESDGKYSVVMNWCLDRTYNYSQVGLAILSSARAYMDTLFDECEHKGINIYDSHPYCIVIDSSNVLLLTNRIGDQIGKLKIEAQGEGYVIDTRHYKVGEHVRPRSK